MKPSVEFLVIFLAVLAAEFVAAKMGLYKA